MTATATKPKRRTKKKKSGKRNSTTNAGTRKDIPRGDVIYPEIGVDLRNKDNPLPVEEAKKLLGWITEQEASESTGKEVNYGKDYTFKDLEGNKVRLTNNVTNRPFRMTLSKRYAVEILRGKWRLNGETLIIDKYGYCQDCQHRLVALVLAEQMRKNQPEKWKAYGVDRPVKMDCLIVTGIDPKPETVDTINLGQKRTLGDVLFRNHNFGEDVSDRDQKRLSNILSHATRLCWLRAGGQDVSDAPHFPHSEALDFIQAHPKLIECVVFIYANDDKEKRISSYISLGYAAALMYLLSMAATEPDQYHEDGTLDNSLWEKAEQFWVEFATGEKDLHSLRTALTRIDSSGGMGRDEVVGTVVKAMNRWMDGKPVDSKSVKVRKTKDENGKPILKERPRLGGIDADVKLLASDPEPKDEVPQAPETAQETPNSPPKKKPKKGKQSKPGWKEGDMAWVNDEDGEHWFGTIQTVDEDESTAQVEDEDTGSVYLCPFDMLTPAKPE